MINGTRIGLKAWRQANLPLAHGEQGQPEVSGSTAPLTVDAGYWASREEVLAVLAGQAPGTLLCALSKGLFEGSAVTRYARRGHIPGSLNRPARELFDEQVPRCGFMAHFLKDAHTDLPDKFIGYVCQISDVAGCDGLRCQLTDRGELVLG